MSSYCKELHDLLRDDLAYFGKNDLESLGQSNIKKTEIIDQLAFLVDGLKKEVVIPESNSSGFFEKIIDNVQPESEKDQLKSVVQEIKSEINNCSNFILTNNQVFSKSLQHLKNMWELVLSMNKTEIGVYDHTGKVK